MPEADAWLDKHAARLDAALLEVSHGVPGGNPVLFAGDRLRFPKEPKGAGGAGLVERDVGRLAARGVVPATRITDVLSQAERWTGFVSRLGHISTGLPPPDERAPLTALIGLWDQPRPLAHGGRLRRRFPASVARACGPGTCARRRVPRRVGVPWPTARPTTWAASARRAASRARGSRPRSDRQDPHHHHRPPRTARTRPSSPARPMRRSTPSTASWATRAARAPRRCPPVAAGSPTSCSR